MIISTLSTCERYYVLGDGFKKAFEFLKNNDIRNMEPGRYDIDGDKVYVLCRNIFPRQLIIAALRLIADMLMFNMLPKALNILVTPAWNMPKSRSLSMTRKQMQYYLKKNANSFFSKKAILRLSFPKTRICRKKGH
jgi:hypothetical protein